MSRVTSLAVAIPARNAVGTIGATLASVLAEDDGRLEILVVDDRSTDGTRAAIRAAAGERVRLLEGSGRGVAGARNIALSAAQAEWVAFLDADDRWLPGRLAALRRAIAGDPEAVACFGAARHVDEQGRLIQIFRASADNATLEGLLKRWLQPTTSATAVRRAVALAVGGFDEGFRRPAGVEDIDLWWRLARVGRCVVQEKPLVEYLVKDSRDGARERAALEDLRADRLRCIERLRGAVDDRLFRRAAAQHLAVMARYWLNAGMPQQARRDAVDALRLSVTRDAVAVLLIALLPARGVKQARSLRRVVLRATRR